MFELFTDGARQVVVLAQDEARGMGHDWIGAEHLLLALLGDVGGEPARLLDRQGIALDAVREELRAVVGDRDEKATGHIPFTRAAKTVLTSSAELRADEHQRVDAGHLLLALLRLEEGVAHEVLTGLGADLAAIEDDLVPAVAAAPLATTSVRQHRWRERDADRLDRIERRLEDVVRRLDALERARRDHG